MIKFTLSLHFKVQLQDQCKSLIETLQQSHEFEVQNNPLSVVAFENFNEKSSKS